MLAAADAAVVTAITSAAESLKDTLMGVGTAVLPFAAAVLALTAGWRFARRFIK